MNKYLIVTETETIYTLYLALGESEKEALEQFKGVLEDEDFEDEDFTETDEPDYYEIIKVFPYSDELLLKYLHFDDYKVAELCMGIQKKDAGNAAKFLNPGK